MRTGDENRQAALEAIQDARNLAELIAARIPHPSQAKAIAYLQLGGLNALNDALNDLQTAADKLGKLHKEFQATKEPKQ